MPEAGASNLSSNELNSVMWRALDRLRGYVPVGDYMNYLFPLILFKRISDNRDAERSMLLTDDGDEAPLEVGGNYRYIIPDGCHWRDLMVSTHLRYATKEIITKLAEANPEELLPIFEEINWIDFLRLPESVISNLIHSIDQLALSSSAVPNEMLGAAFEHLLRQFAEAAGGGAFVTPQGLVRLVIRIVDPRPGETIYDPACGTGGMLTGAINELLQDRSNDADLQLYGQEVIPQVAAMARMNLIVHGLSNYKISSGDTLRSPGFLEGSQLQTFDIVIADPPFSAKNWGSEEWMWDPYGRAFCGVPPARAADLAWVQHIIASMSRPNGTAAVILPHGSLFRSGAEQAIRRCLIEHDYIESIIALPPNLFYASSLHVSLLVIKHNKRTERRGGVLFIDATGLGTRENNIRQIDRSYIESIVASYRSGESGELPLRMVEIAEIDRNGWNLEASRYLSPLSADQESGNSAVPRATSAPTMAPTEPLNQLITQELGEVCSVVAGRNRVARDDDIDQEFRVIRAEDIRLSLVQWSELPQSNRRRASSVEVSPGDIIGSISGPYGRWVVVPEDYGSAFAGDHTVVLKPNGDVSMWYVLGFLRSSRGKELIKSTQRGAVISRISRAELERIRIPFCPLQADYVDSVLKGFEEENDRLERGIEELRSRLGTVYDSTGSVEIGARLDALQGIAASIRGMTNLGDAIRIARNSYPYPVARSLHAIGNTVNPRERYHETIHEVSEAMSVILASICAGVARERAIRGGNRFRAWVRQTKGIGATIGTRNQMVFEIAENLITTAGSGDIGGIGRALGDLDAPAVKLLRKLLEERNRIHGDYPRTDLQFQQRLMAAESDTQQLLEALSFLARWEFRYAEFVEPVEDSDGSTIFAATFRVLRGENPDWEIAAHTSRSPLYRGRVYAFVDDQYLLDLHPFILVRPCQICGSLEVYHPSSFSNDEVNLKSIDRGHAQVTSDTRLIAALGTAFT